MATAATDIYALADAKRDLRVRADETRNDALIGQYIAEAVDYIGRRIDAPLIQRQDTYAVEGASGSAEPIRIPARHITQVTALRYWGAGETAAEQPQQTIDLTTARTLREDGGAGPYLRVWPPGGAWPEMSRGTALADVMRELPVTDAENAGVRAAVRLKVRELYDGLAMSGAAIERLLAPYLSMDV